MWRFKPFMPKENAGLEGRTIDVGNLKVHVRNAIAEGGFSCVYLARDAVHSSKQYALKHMICNDEESLSVVVKEISVMKRLKGHPNVVVLAASDIFDMGRTKEAIIVMDFCEKSLVSVLESRGATYYEEKQVLLIFRDVCNAVFAMHCQSPPVAHRDLKAENVLLGSDGTWKLCDFGSTSTNHKRFDKPGEMGIEEDNIRKHTTPAYRAPEMWDLLRRDIVSEKVDIWALGCLLYRICYFKSAFDGESKLQVLNGNYRIPEMPKYNSSITDLINDMLQTSPDSRPDITQVWFQVNLLLPLDLQKETPNGSFSRTTTDIHRPATNTYDEVITKMSSVMPQRIAPYSSSTKGQVRSMSARYVEERSRTSLGDSRTTGDGPLGMFWTTLHQSSTQVTEKKIPKSDKELPSQSVSKHNEQKIGKRSSPSREQRAKEPPRTVRGDSVIKSDDVPSADFEIRFESGRGIGKTKISYAGNQKTAVLNSENRTPFPNETFNTFVAEFDPSKLATDSGSRKDLQGELESLKKQLKQSNFEKADMTSKFEKLSAICRSQRQEIQELKRALAAVNQPPSNKVNLKSQSTPCSGQSSFQQREKIEGSLLELQEGVFANASASRGKDSRAWQPFAKEPKPLAMSKSNNSKSVRTSDCTQSKSTTASIATGPWSFDQDGFTAAVSSSQTSRTSFQSSSSQRYSSSNVKKVQTTQPAGWAGF